MRYTVCKVADLENKKSCTFDLGDTEVGIILHKGRVYAYENVCAHMGGPVCLGDVSGRVKMELNPDMSTNKEYVSEDEVHLVCPWHGYEFDIETGEFVSVPHLKIKKFNAFIADEEVVVEI